MSEENNCYTCKLFNDYCPMNRAVKYDFESCEYWKPEKKSSSQTKHIDHKQTTHN